MRSVIIFLLWAILAIIIIIGVWITLMYLLPMGIYAQETKTTTPTTTAPPPITPIPAVPADTSPQPNPQYLPQKAYVQLFAPEIGIPNTSPTLPVIATTTTTAPVAPATASSGLGIPGLDIAAIAALVGTGITYVKTHIIGKKAEKTEEVTKEQSAQIVKGASVDQSLADQVYKNMSDGGESIHDKPEIRLETLADNKEEAVKTATKA